MEVHDLPTPALVIEADELWSFVGTKQEPWGVWVALDAVTRQVVAMVAGDRSAYTAQCLWEALPDDYREVIVLRHLEGLTFPAVADRMGRSVDSVEKLWLRAVARLKHAIGEG